MRKYLVICFMILFLLVGCVDENKKEYKLILNLNNGSGEQTGDNVKIRNYGIYNKNGDTGKSSGLIGINIINGNDANAPTEYYNLQGIRIPRPTSPGIYIIKKGNKASKTIIR